MEIINDISQSVFSIVISCGIIAFILREYLKRYLDYVFKQKEQEISRRSHIDIETIKTYVPILVEINELVYKMNNYSKELIESKTPVGIRRDSYVEICNALTERIYTYRAYLEPKSFELLHDFKRVNQDFLLLLNVSDRDESIIENGPYFDEKTLSQLEELHIKINSIFNKVTESIQGKLNVT